MYPGEKADHSFKAGEIHKKETFYDKALENRIVRKISHRLKLIPLSKEESTWDEWVHPRFYPNQGHLRKRNTVVEHPYGTVKKWHGVSYLLTSDQSPGSNRNNENDCDLNRGFFYADFFPFSDGLLAIVRDQR